MENLEEDFFGFWIFLVEIGRLNVLSLMKIIINLHYQYFVKK
jgi:hypothetical protein